MSAISRLWLCGVAAWLALPARAAETNALTLIKTIPLPEVRGRMDHFALDAAGQRLFVAALGNDTVEVLDLAAGRRVRTIGGCAEPQGVAFVPGVNRLVIANGGSGTVRFLEGSSLKLADTISNLPDADNVQVDAAAGLIYVGYGDGALALINTNGQVAGNIPLAAHPESFQLEANGQRIFVNVPGAHQVAVVDRGKRKVVATWPTGGFHSNFPMALDEANHRLFVGCRHPARLLVLDTLTGKQTGAVEVVGDADDVFYDAKRGRIYVSGGGGFIDVLEFHGADGCRLCERIATPGGARTGFFAPDRDEFYLAVRAGIVSGSAEIRVFKVND